MNIFYKYFWTILEKLFENVRYSYFMEPSYKSREISDERYNILLKFIKNLEPLESRIQNYDQEWTIGLEWKMLENVGENGM